MVGAFGGHSVERAEVLATAPLAAVAFQLQPRPQSHVMLPAQARDRADRLNLNGIQHLVQQAEPFSDLIFIPMALYGLQIGRVEL